MARYFAAHTDAGPCVASNTYMGAIVVLECTTEQRAQSEAQRMNWEDAARQAIPKRAPAHYGMRRSVRQFINEDIHG